MSEGESSKIEQAGKLATLKRQLLLAFLGILVGAIVSVLEVIFGKVLLGVTNVREAYPFYFIPFLPLAGLLIVFCYKKVGKNTDRGMGLVFDVGHAQEDVIPWRLIPLTMASTWLTHLFGGSAGREGVAVQIGATVSHGIGRKIGLKDTSRIFLVVGMAAGFAGLFETPIAAIFFAMEVLVAGELVYEALLPAFTAAITAALVSKVLGLSKFSYNLKVNDSFDMVMIIKLILLGIIFGIVGSTFARVLKWSKKFFSSKIKNPYVRVLTVGVVLSILFLLLYKGRYSGLGESLVDASFHSGQIFGYDWILKSILTVVTLSIGFQGGELTPLFAIGSTLGVVLAGFFGLPADLVAALGYVAVFGGATNTLLGPILIGTEVFGFENFPYFFIVCVIAYACNQNQSIYSGQKIKKPFLAK